MRKYVAAAVALLAVFIGILPAAADGSAPVAENFEFETYRGVSFGGRLEAVDPDGGALSFEITTPPKKGSIELGDDGEFVYTPDEGKKGRDYFGYRATDAEGNRSQEATVIIKLLKNKEISYIDMDGNASYCSAVKLAECGAFTGTRVGGEYYFEPERTLSRGEFLSICLSAMGSDVFSGVVSTGFADDESIPDWQKGYVASAVKCGAVKGRYDNGSVFFAPEDTISRAEAGVILNRLLALADVGYISADDSVPVWAAQAAANLSACNIISGSADTSPLTRAEAADMLAAAMQLEKNR